MFQVEFGVYDNLFSKCLFFIFLIFWTIFGAAFLHLWLYQQQQHWIQRCRMFSNTRRFWHIKKSFDALASPHITLWFLTVKKVLPTKIVSSCFPSNGKNSRMQTSKLPEFTFSNQTYVASLDFVSRVYFAEANTEGLPPKLWNVNVKVSSMGSDSIVLLLIN